MDADRDERIRQRAYELWEQEGAPEGRHQDHWDEAARQIDAEPAAQTVREGHDAGDHAGLAAEPGDEDAKLDIGLDESFPASDPPAQTVPPKAKRKPAKPKAKAAK